MPKKLIYILAFESSCDDTSVAVLCKEPNDDLPKLVSLAVQNQDEVHAKYGGIVPELASRAHLVNLLPCLRKALTEAKLKIEEVSLICAAAEPGLVGSLLVGHTAAKTLAFLYKKDFVSCHHIEGHLHSILLTERPSFPLVSLVVSGGHTSLYELSSVYEWRLLGQTLDDAIGEAFDKGAKSLGLGFPGGAELEILAKSGDNLGYKFPSVKVGEFDFSFSGLKSEFMRILVREAELVNHQNLAASYQKALFDHLESRLRNGLESTGCLNLAIVGGVAKNQELRSRLEGLKSEGLIANFWAAKPEYCTDNAAMIGMTGYLRWSQGFRSELSDDVRSTHRPKLKKLSRG
ncbi:MAG: tRNA (adenosine(37)-N6)-threonylcarbamoyltransferase complex transferase subunit TsaD [Deltaproteobacteria bacterium CG11_big_fil_rev_8_21_14_0_20_45_16]|nr:MAG: tRNA (adenosine(37)-N6)-threonylcarbamoyltransferase complex transferase subunit TsaD [Deltaproteobacteria bacterium CG11_big_fil_rev_8_21_14_0_20_45_16]